MEATCISRPASWGKCSVDGEAELKAHLSSSPGAVRRHQRIGRMKNVDLAAVDDDLSIASFGSGRRLVNHPPRAACGAGMTRSGEAPKPLVSPGPWHHTSRHELDDLQLGDFPGNTVPSWVIRGHSPA